MTDAIKTQDIQILSAPSILGLRPSGVENLATALFEAGLAQAVHSRHPVMEIPLLNDTYTTQRDPVTHCINGPALRTFSSLLADAISQTIAQRHFALTLGGDCSILIGIMAGLAARGKYGLVFLDAHADFYEPQKSVTGEAADMDLAIVTGRGPALLTNINSLGPYVTDDHVIHIGQRDWEETQHYGSQDIKETSITCFDLKAIAREGITVILQKTLTRLESMAVDGFWIHFDTDVLSDAINPAVDYRLPGGITCEQARVMLAGLLATDRTVGMSVTIFNPSRDEDGRIARDLTILFGNVFQSFL